MLQESPSSADSVIILTPRHPGLRRGASICQAAHMPGWSPASRQRSSAAIVMTRTESPAAAREASSQAQEPRPRDWQWLWWIPLGLLVAGVWTLLVFGDSLRAPLQ